MVPTDPEVQGGRGGGFPHPVAQRQAQAVQVHKVLSVNALKESGVEIVQDVLLDLAQHFVLIHRRLTQFPQKDLGCLLESLALDALLLYLLFEASVFLLDDRIVLLVFYDFQVFLARLPGRQERT